MEKSPIIEYSDTYEVMENFINPSLSLTEVWQLWSMELWSGRTGS